MDADRDPFIENVARELRADPVNASLDARIMNAVRRTGIARWPRLLTPRRMFVTPLPWLLSAVGALIVAGMLGASVSQGGERVDEMEGEYVGDSQHVQFVFVSTTARKVTVVGDFNSWDRARPEFQARHSGGSVWTLTAPIPVGHHRYSFIVDDSIWVADPYAPAAFDHDFGVPKSALVIRPGK